MQIEQINIFNSNMEPEDGGIQNTAYIFVQSFSKKFKVNGYTGKLAKTHSLKNIEVTKKYTLCSTVKWLMEHSQKNTINIAMNCWEALPALIVKKLTGAKYIVLAHGNDIYSFGVKGNFKHTIYNLINKSIFEESLYIACNSRYTQGLLKNEKLISKSVVIHPPCSKFEAPEKEILYDKNIIFSIGRLVERKGFQYIIQALPSLIENYSELKYYLAGDGPYKSVLIDLVKNLSLEKHVTFLGRVTDEEKIHLYKECAVFVMTSIEISNDDTVEGFGIVYVEANQLGKYVIAGECGGVPEAVSEGVTGSVLKEVTTQSVENELRDFYGKIECLYTNSMVKKRKEWAESHFVDNITEQYINELNNRIEGK